MSTLSIIVPVYNKLQYLDETVQSILSQTFGDFELILVNDGSNDGSGEKCRTYELLDKRVKVVDQVNLGVSEARNTGLRMARGSFCGFVDADDTVEPDMYQVLIENALAHSADISCCGIRISKLNSIKGKSSGGNTEVFDHDQALVLNMKGVFHRNVTNKIYRTALASSIPFEGDIYEDILFLCKAFLVANKTVSTSGEKYNYQIRDNSVSMSKFNVKYLQTIAVSKQMVVLVRNESEECRNEAMAFDVMANVSLLNLLLLSSTVNYTTAYETVVRNLKRYRKFILYSPHVRRKHKYAVQLFSISPSVYRITMYVYCRLTNSDVIYRSN